MGKERRGIVMTSLENDKDRASVSPFCFTRAIPIPLFLSFSDNTPNKTRIRKRNKNPTQHDPNRDMAEVGDLDEWEVLSRNSSCCKDEEFEEEDDDGFTYFDYLCKDPEKRGEISDVGKKSVVGFVVGESSGGNLVKLSNDFDSEVLVSSDGKGFGVGVDASTGLTTGFDENGADFVRDDDPTEEFVASVVTCDEQESIAELGFGEMEVLNEFYLNQIDDDVVNYDKSCLNDSAFPFQGIDNSDSVFANQPISEVDWKSPRATERFFEMQMGFQKKVSSGNCSNEGSFNLAKDPEEQHISESENKTKRTDAEIGGEDQDGVKGEKVLLSWWKVPVEVIKYCVFGVRPVWSISMAMGFLGFLMFSRKYYLYKMNQKDSKTRPALKVCFDEKKRAAIQTRAARLNKAVGLIRQDPILRTPLPAFGVTMFPAMSSFQWAP